jgi:hypothetical protein
MFAVEEQIVSRSGRDWTSVMNAATTCSGSSITDSAADSRSRICAVEYIPVPESGVAGEVVGSGERYVGGLALCVRLP